jgi:hypothetical protein
MRTPGFLLACLLAAAGCKDKSDAATTSSADPAALKAQQEMVARRDALVAQRQKLEGERDKLDQEIEKAKASGSDTSELAKKREQIESQIKDQSPELTNLTSKIDQVVQQGGAAVAIATREANMSSRERGVADRERLIATREKDLAQREKELAQREKDTCGGGSPMIIQQVAAPKGENYTRKDIEPLLGRARATMQKKGILPGDLGPAANLENEATKGMADGNWGKAYLAAAQLAATVDAVKIDRAFITAKYGRLNSRVSSGKLDEATSAQLTEGMKEVLQKYGDGDFNSANRKLNALNALVH